MRCIVVEYRDKGRKAGRSEWMKLADAQAEFDRVVGLLEQTKPDGDRLIRVGSELMVRAREVHNIHLERPARISTPKAGRTNRKGHPVHFEFPEIVGPRILDFLLRNSRAEPL